MKINKTTIIPVVLAGPLVSALSAGISLSERSMAAGVTPSVHEGKVSEGSDDDEADDGA